MFAIFILNKSNMLFDWLLFSVLLLLVQLGVGHGSGSSSPKSNFTIVEDDNEVHKIVPLNDIISTDPDDIEFYLYPDPKKLSYKETLKFGNIQSIESSSYKTSLPLTFYVHGFVTNSSDPNAQGLKDAYLNANYPTNLILVDWGKLSTPKPVGALIYYVAAVDNVPIVGKRIAQFIEFLYKNQKVSNMNQVHVIGFSLGAHVAGITGSSAMELGLEQLGRVTGLDPAGPLYQLRGNEEKIDPSDGAFVDIVHTNQGLKGYSGLLGHIDFFPNGGGPYQPGCVNETNIEEIFTGSCSHGRAPQFFAKSLSVNITACNCGEERKLVGLFDSIIVDRQKSTNLECKKKAEDENCNSPVIFGVYCPPSARGVYYVEITN